MKKIKNPKISFIFKKTLVLSIICGKCNSKDEKIFQEKGTGRYMTEKNISQEFRLKYIDKSRNYSLKN